MKHIKRYNNFSINENYTELEYTIDDMGTNDMMYKTSAIINLVRDWDKLGDIIKSTLSEDTYDRLFSGYGIISSEDVSIYFITTVIDQKDLKKMFNNVAIQSGSDDETEYVAALEINGKVVLILHSPNRGSQIRIQDDKYITHPNGYTSVYTITEDEVIDIVKEICKIYNEKL